MNHPEPPLALIGAGYQIETSLAAEGLKHRLIRWAAPIDEVTNDFQRIAATAALSALADFRIGLEKSRTEVKAPVVSLGKLIDARAAEFGKDVAHQEARIKGLLSAYAVKQEQERRRVIDEARKLELEAERKRVEAEALARKAEAPKASFGAAAKALQQATAATEQASLFTAQSGALTAAAPAAVRMVLDYEIHSISELYQSAPWLVDLTPRRADILEAIREGKRPAGITIKEVPKIR